MVGLSRGKEQYKGYELGNRKMWKRFLLGKREGNQYRGEGRGGQITAGLSEKVSKNLLSCKYIYNIIHIYFLYIYLYFIYHTYYNIYLQLYIISRIYKF